MIGNALEVQEWSGTFAWGRTRRFKGTLPRTRGMDVASGGVATRSQKGKDRAPKLILPAKFWRSFARWSNCRAEMRGSIDDRNNFPGRNIDVGAEPRKRDM